MKERPILFSGAMVCVILRNEDPKTETRRLNQLKAINQSPDSYTLIHTSIEMKRNGDIVTIAKFQHKSSGEIVYVPCPHGKPQDRLWVKETFWVEQDSEWDEWSHKTYYSSIDLKTDNWADVKYVATNPDFSGHDGISTLYEKRPSIFMPRWASRITLEITDIRVERLQSISEEDAIAEGLTALSKDGQTVKYGIPDRDGLPGDDDYGWHWSRWCIDPCKAYQHLWDSINGKTYPWERDPWVWVVQFKRV
ncbi:hypothetical protein LBWT_11960 [Leptolyngbya boryana IAM M-101]|uniref:hypothetical protein n=1 Tax=Leptolyngbya boryana TaxID=1184 RepID=UPI000A350D9F|nr:hypothetical protein [Leptolyngbya boryana]BAS55290.1 hypothetical protein LBWT_11960 [Leptolyngbya boryana IAM M-101]